MTMDERKIYDLLCKWGPLTRQEIFKKLGVITDIEKQNCTDILHILIDKEYVQMEPTNDNNGIKIQTLSDITLKYFVTSKLLSVKEDML
ncbi:MAG: hypothetical protein LBN21_00635 [Treponema sp.]|jgi:hypothetical protein|nr:hypothetical protein [Treponema sp.]